MATSIRSALFSRVVAPLKPQPIHSINASHLYRPSIRQRSLATTSTPPSQEAPPPTTPFTTQPRALEMEASAATFPPLTYHVHRTPSQQLPIYHLAKAGGNKHQTRIRKITGSVEDLKRDLTRALGLGEKDIAINAVNGHIVIKGWKKFEVAKFLQEEKHF